MSYRREEAAYPAGWLYDRLADHFGSDQVFKDVDSIELGDDFVEVITRAVGACAVLLAVIGREWLTITDAHGQRRLDNPNDFVRLEIEAALTRNVRVIPILVDGASMPRADELPDSLARLERRQALELSPARFAFDTGRLLKVLDRTLAEVRTEYEDAASMREPTEKAPAPSTTEVQEAPGRETKENVEGATKNFDVDAFSTPLQQPTVRVARSGPTSAPFVVSHRWRRAGLIAGAGLVSVALVGWGVLATMSDRGGPGTSELPPTTSAPRFGSWEPGPDLLTPVEAAGVAPHRGAVWAIGGDTLSSPYMTRDVQVLNPPRRRWTKGPSLPVPLRDAVAVSTGETLYVLGGITTNGVVDTVYRFDERRRRWVLDPRALPEPRAGGAGAWDGTRLLFGGGVDSKNNDRAEVWALGADGWDRVAMLSEPRNSLAATSDGAGTTWFLAGQRNRTVATGKMAASGAVDRLRGGTLSPEKPVRARRAVSAAFVPGAGPCVVGGVPHLSRSADPTVECPFAPLGIKAPRLHTSRAGIGTVVLDGQLFAVGGFSHFGQNGSVTVEVLPLR
jgi:hypothetical protein